MFLTNLCNLRVFQRSILILPCPCFVVTLKSLRYDHPLDCDPNSKQAHTSVGHILARMATTPAGGIRTAERSSLEIKDLLRKLHPSAGNHKDRIRRLNKFRNYVQPDVRIVFCIYFVLLVGGFYISLVLIGGLSISLLCPYLRRMMAL
jgi:hypothetical protein